MAIPTGAVMAAEAVRERLTPALETLDETMRRGRRAVSRGQHAAEDAAAAATLEIRRRPLSAVMMAAGLGAVAGALMGFALGRLAPCKDW